MWWVMMTDRDQREKDVRKLGLEEEKGEWKPTTITSKVRC
jgi:hypothetical protein